jgi:hypothetical protein
MPRPPIACPWLPELAEGYLRAYSRVSPLRRAGLWGFSVESQAAPRGAGFFVGFLTGKVSRSAGLAPASLHLPECVVLAYVRPAGSSLHRRLVRRPKSLFRRGHELLTKYTARPPRFQFQETSWAVLARHAPLSAFPSREREKYARNFFKETLALLVRSGLPRRLLQARKPRPSAVRSEE